MLGNKAEILYSVDMTMRYVLIRQLTALACVLGMTFLLLGSNGQKEAGISYALVNTLRKSSPPHQKFLLIDSRGYHTPRSLGNMYLVLTEFRTEAALTQIEVHLESTEERFETTKQYFNNEFSTIDTNIQTLFDGIRYGSIQAQDADRFVSGLLELNKKSKDKLLLRVSGKSANGLDVLQENQELFMNEAGLLNLDPDDYSAFSVPEPAILDDIKPILEAVFPENQIKDSSLPEDTSGKVLLEYPVQENGSNGFRHMSAELFDQYLALEQKLYASLKEMERLGYFSGLDPLEYPTTMYEYANSLLQEARNNNDSRSTQAWRNAKEKFYSTTAAVLDPDREAALKAAFQTEAQKNPAPDKIQEIQAFQALAEQSFSWTRASFDRLSSQRQNLQQALYGAVCFIGPSVYSGAESIVHRAALISHTVLSPGPVQSVTARQLLFISLIPALIAALLLGVFRPAKALLSGIGVAFLYMLLLSLLYIKGKLWIDPEAGTLALLTAAAVSAGSQRILGIRYRHSCKKRFGNRVSKQVLHQLYAEENPANPCGTALTAIIAIRGRQRQKVSTVPDAKEIRSMVEEQTRTAEFLQSRGASILGTDGEILFAAFNSPLWTMQDPAQKAVETMLILSRTEEYKTSGFHAGVDIGPCVFDYHPLQGYTAYGKALIYARLLSALAPSYNSELLISASVYSVLTEQGPWLKKDCLVDKETGEEHVFYSCS